MRPIKFIQQPVKCVCVCVCVCVSVRDVKRGRGLVLFNYGTPFYPNQGRKLSQVLTGSLAERGETGNNSLYIQITRLS